MDFSTTSRAWRFAERSRERLVIGLALSLLVHGFLLSLEFGIPGLGLPGLNAPWNERRAQMPEISVVLAPAPAPAPPAPLPAPPPAPALPPPSPLPQIAQATKGLKLVPPRAAAPKPSPAKAKAAPVRPPKPKPAQVKSQPKLIAQTESRNDKFIVAPPDPDIPAESVTSKVETQNPPVEVAEAPAPETAPVKPEEPVPLADAQAQLEQKRAEEEAARQAKEAEARKQEEENARRLAQEREAQREQEQEAARQRDATLALQREQEAAKKREQEAATQRALELERQRIAALKKQQEEKAAQEKAVREAAELAARKQAEEEARRRTAELERQRQAEELARQKQAEELARQKQADELARQKQAEELAAKVREQELAHQRAEAAAAEQRRIAEETGRAAAAAAAARQAGNDGRQGTGALSRNPYGGGDLASRALEQVRRPDLLRMEPPRPGSGEPERSQRRSVFGSLDRDVGLAMYIKSWSLKIERNGSLNYSQLSKERARGDPIVTVAVRSDGSVEEVIINRSSGRADLDEAVRRIVRLNARYSVFPPELARKYDVIEIRRIWNFDDTLRLIEEVR